MPFGVSRTIIATIVLLTLGLLSPPASAAAETSLSITASKGYAGTPTHLRVALADGGTPFVGTVIVQRRVDGAWTTIATPTTDAQGLATVDAPLAEQSKDNVFRARYAGDGTHGSASTGPEQARLLRRNSVVRVGGPKQVVDGRRTVVRVQWHTRSGRPWCPARCACTSGWATGGGSGPAPSTPNAQGRATLRVRPRVDSRWRVTVQQARLDHRRPQPRPPDRQPAARRAGAAAPDRAAAADQRCRRSAGPSATARTPWSPASRTASGGR